MTRTLLTSLAPWFGLLVLSLAVLWLLLRASSARFDWRRIAHLHADQGGSAQTLSFVLTLPLFIWVLMLIVQISQLMIAQIVVEYAAFATARAAIVWIPAHVQSGSRVEGVNSLSVYQFDLEAENQVPPSLEPSDGGLTYVVAPGSPKFEKIASAAWMALMPVCPSRDLPSLRSAMPSRGEDAVAILQRAYAAVAPGSSGNLRTNPRLWNKLAYALNYTDVQIRFFHSNREPPLDWRLWPIYTHPCVFRYPFVLNEELGWQDTITVKVRHRLALLPGPGRLLFRQQSEEPAINPNDPWAPTIRQSNEVYTYPLTAAATLGNEGQESVIPYAYQAY